MADSKSRHQVEAVGAGRAQAVLRPLWGGLVAPTPPVPTRGQFVGSVDGVSQARRGSP